MPFRLHKRIRLLPGIWFNVSKTGVSTSIGGKGVTVNLSKHGVRTTVGVPGTGLTYTSTSSDGPSQGTKQKPEPSRAGGRTRTWAILLWVILILVLAVKMR